MPTKLARIVGGSLLFCMHLVGAQSLTGKHVSDDVNDDVNDDVSDGVNDDNNMLTCHNRVQLCWQTVAPCPQRAAHHP